MTEDHYPPRLIAMLEAVWGEGFMSPGGPDEVARVVGAHDLAGKTVLDIGCGAGGIDLALVRNHGAGFVLGIDVEDAVLDRARQIVSAAGLTDRIGVVKVAPGPLPFPPAAFDVVFSKDSIVHIPDKHALMREVFRVLRPGGWFAASDWLIGHDGTPSPEMARYIAAEGLDFGMASPCAMPMPCASRASSMSPPSPATCGTAIRPVRNWPACKVRRARRRPGWLVGISSRTTSGYGPG